MTLDQLLALLENAGFGANAIAGLIGGPLLLTLFSFVCMCIIMHKCGRTGWCLLIPIYNIYVLFKLWWKTKKFGAMLLWIILLIIASVGVGLATGNEVTGLMPESVAKLVLVVGIVLTVVATIALLVMTIKLNCGHLAKAFGKDSGFAVGLFFLPIIFLAIIAFDKEAKYVGAHD